MVQKCSFVIKEGLSGRLFKARQIQCFCTCQIKNGEVQRAYIILVLKSSTGQAIKLDQIKKLLVGILKQHFKHERNQMIETC